MKYEYLAKVIANKDKNLMYGDMASAVVANAYQFLQKSNAMHV